MTANHAYAWAEHDVAPIPVRAPNPRTYLTPFGLDLLVEVMNPDGARFVAVNGGVGSSKSFAIAQIVRVVAETRPGSSILLTGSSLNLLMAVLKKRCDAVFGHVAKWKGGTIEPHYIFPNGSKVTFRAYVCHKTRDESSNSLEGSDYTLTIADEVEQLPISIVTHALERTRLISEDLMGTQYDPQVILIGRPGVVDFWMQEAVKLGKGGMHTKVMQPRTWDNPTLWTIDPYTGLARSPYIENLRRKMSLQEFNCKTAHVPGTEMPVTGAIYGDFVPAVAPQGNLIDWVYDGRPCVAALDFGRAYPAVVFITQVNLFGREVDVVFDELQPDDCLTPQLVRMVKERGHNITEIVCDPAGTTANGQTGISDIQLMGEGVGVPVVYTTASDMRRITSGISRVRSLICNADGERQLFVTKELWERAKASDISARTIRSLLKYTWKMAEKGLTPNKGGVGQPDHVADALRYWVIRYRWRDDTEVRSLTKDIYAPAPLPKRRLGRL